MMEFKWHKLGRIFDPTKITGYYYMKQFAQAPAVLVFDEFVRVYFSCRPLPDSTGLYISYSAYVDLDPNNLFNIIRFSDSPILKLGDLGTFDEFGTYPVSVIKIDGKILAYYAGWTRCESVPFNVAIGVGVSSDGGNSFIKLGPGPILSYSPEEPFVLSGPKIRSFEGRYYMFYIAGKKWIIDKGRPEPIYKIRMATSNDGLNWEKCNRDIISVVLDEDEAQASPDVFFLNGMYHMFFCYRHCTGYRSKERGYRIGYAYSYDLFNWTRDDSKCGIDVSAEGWDSEMISYPHIFNLRNEIYMLYLGNQVGKYGFGLAKFV